MNLIETVGLNVLSVIPSGYKTNVNVNTQILIEFNIDLDKTTIVESFALLEDIERCYTPGDEIDFTKFNFIKGGVHYHKKVITFTPSEQLKKNSRYILYVKPNAVRDIFGKSLIQKYVSIFDTESTSHDVNCDISFPVTNSIIDSLDKVECTEIPEANYLIQISKTSTFETKVYESIESSNVIEKDFGLGDGLYYIRAKSLNGDFGEAVSFSVMSYRNTTPTDDDIDEMYIYRPVEDEEVKLLEQFPLGVNVNTKTNVLYMKFQGIVPIEEIDFYESSLIGILSDDDDADTLVEHGEVEGSFIVVHDEEELQTYVFYIPVSM